MEVNHLTKHMKPKLTFRGWTLIIDRPVSEVKAYWWVVNEEKELGLVVDVKRLLLITMLYSSFLYMNLISMDVTSLVYSLNTIMFWATLCSGQIRKVTYWSAKAAIATSEAPRMWLIERGWVISLSVVDLVYGVWATIVHWGWSQQFVSGPLSIAIAFFWYWVCKNHKRHYG